MIAEKEYENYSKDTEKLNNFKMSLQSKKLGTSTNLSNQTNQINTKELKNAIGEHEFQN